MTSRNPLARLLHPSHAANHHDDSHPLDSETVADLPYAVDHNENSTGGPLITAASPNPTALPQGRSRPSSMEGCNDSALTSSSPTPTTVPLPPALTISNSSNTYTSSRTRTSTVGSSTLMGPRDTLPPGLIPTSDSISIEFDGSSHVIVRPNRIIRGIVNVSLTERTYCSRIRIKFRAEETAAVQVDEGSGELKGFRIHQLSTTFFEADYKLWGCETSNYQLATWDELEPGGYSFPFALKFPNVNFPPSIEEPPGFSIRYIWTAIIDGPGLTSGLRSKEHVTPYRPIIVAPPNKEWVFRASLKKEGKEQSKTTAVLAEAQAKLPRQAVCPDEPLTLHLTVSPVQPDLRVVHIMYRLRKHHEGRLLLQRGTAFRDTIRMPVTETITIDNPKAGEPVVQQISFTMPTRLVSPSFSSRHTRVHYDLAFTVAFESTSLMFKTSSIAEFYLPIAVANLPNDHLLRIPDLTAIADYRRNLDAPFFFSPDLENPPLEEEFPAELIEPPIASPISPSQGPPPSYFSLPPLPPMNKVRQRIERTVYSTRVPRLNGWGELGEPIVVKGLADEDW